MSNDYVLTLIWAGFCISFVLSAIYVLIRFIQEQARFEWEQRERLRKIHQNLLQGLMTQLGKDKRAEK